MSVNEYQTKAIDTAIYPSKGRNLSYPALGLTGEAGEVADKIKKLFRDKQGVLSEEDRKEIAKELGDTLWYIAAMAYELAYDLDDIAQMNLDKLDDRKERGVISGDGDNR